jgi:hypothetical protein
MAKLEKAPGPGPGFSGFDSPSGYVHQRVVAQFGQSTRSGSEGSRVRIAPTRRKAQPTEGAVDEVGRVARLSPGTRCGFEARPRHVAGIARVAQLEERRSYTPEVGGSKPSAGTRDEGDA